MKQPSYPCSCITCHKLFSSHGIDTHFMRSHGTKEQQDLFKNAAFANKATSAKLQSTYYQLPNYCKECSSVIPYNKRSNIFCSHTCSATASNRERIKNGYIISDLVRESIRNKLKSYNKSCRISRKSLVGFSGPHTKISFKTCKFCSLGFVTPTSKRTRICDKCQHLKWNNNKDKYSFRFNVFDYPDLFDLDQLKLVGWVSFGGKRGGTKNPKGLSRDHRVSVFEAKKFNYDPYYISHPVNCELMPHTTNNKKKTKSSITYTKLIESVNAYDSRVITEKSYSVTPKLFNIK